MLRVLGVTLVVPDLEGHVQHSNWRLLQLWLASGRIGYWVVQGWYTMRNVGSQMKLEDAALSKGWAGCVY